MPYYQGDFYKPGTGYYMGDPFWGFLGKLGRTIGGAVGLPGGGGVSKKALPGLVSQGVSAALTKMRALPPVVKVAGAGAALAASAGAIGGLMAAPGTAMGMPGVGMRGMHMTKARKVYGVVHPPHLVKNRHMHVTNPKALRRAIRRCSGFAKLAKRVLHFTSPRPPRGRAYFRPKRKKRVV